MLKIKKVTRKKRNMVIVYNNIITVLSLMFNIFLVETPEDKKANEYELLKQKRMRERKEAKEGKNKDMTKKELKDLQRLKKGK